MEKAVVALNCQWPHIHCPINLRREEVSEERAIEEFSKELWQRAANNEGSIRADAYVALGRIAFDQGKFKESLALCETAKEIFERESVSEYEREIFDVNIGLSRNFEKLDRQQDAAKALGDAIEAAKAINIEELDDLLRDQGRYWFAAGQYENSIACHQEAIVQTEMFLREESFGIDYFNIGMGLFELGRYEESRDAYLKSRSAFKSQDEIDQVVECDFRLSEIFVELKDPVNIIHHGQKALDFYTILRDDRKVWTLKYFLGVAQRLLGELETAGQFFEDAKSLAIAVGWKEWEFLIKVDRALAELYETNGLHEYAAEILRRVKSVEELAAKDECDVAA
jgi:tetratricopeptide (TPR) repeat protein